jgi:hypothetical protein
MTKELEAVNLGKKSYVEKVLNKDRKEVRGV